MCNGQYLFLIRNLDGYYQSKCLKEIQALSLYIAVYVGHLRVDIMYIYIIIFMCSLLNVYCVVQTWDINTVRLI